jgi:hypothetical protein
MDDLRIQGICAELILRRYVPTQEMAELESDTEIRAEVERRLAAVGLLLTFWPGVPFYGVVAAEVFRSPERLVDYGLTKRHQAMLLYLWARLIAPFVYGEQRVPDSYNTVTVSKAALKRELGKAWSQQAIDISVGFLRNLAFVETVRGSGGDTLCAGPMLWLAIDHHRLGSFLRDYKALDFAVERVLAERAAREEKEEGAIDAAS